MKKNKGITLIALIITIIILIILTAITLNNVIGSDLIGFAGSAAGNYIDAEKEEEKKISELMSKGEEAGKIGGTGGIGEGSKSGIIGDTIDISDYGKYVDYEVDIDGDGTYKDWKIFFKDPGNNRVFIIADDYVTNSDLINQELADKLFSGEGTSALCSGSFMGHLLTLAYDIPYQDILTKPDDIENLFWEREYKISDNKDTGGSALASGFLNISNWDDFLDKTKNCGQYAIGGPTIEMWCRSWSDTHPSNSIIAVPNEIGYQLNYKDSLSAYVTLEGVSSNDDPLWFPRTGGATEFSDAGTDYYGGYWLASPHGGDSRCLFSVFPNYVLSSNLLLGDQGEMWGSIRPLVCLNTNVSCTWNNEKQVYELKAN